MNALENVTSRESESDNPNKQENFIRFQYELEFIQMLANPDYLECIKIALYCSNNRFAD